MCLIDKGGALVYHHYKISYQKGFEGNRPSLIRRPVRERPPWLEADAGQEEQAYRFRSRAGETYSILRRIALVTGSERQTYTLCPAASRVEPWVFTSSPLKSI